MFTQLISKFPVALKQSMVYGLSIALMKSISLIMLPITAYYLQPMQFGQLELLSSIAIVCSVLVGLGLENTLFRFAGTQEDPEENSQGAAVVLTLALIVGGLAMCAGWLIAPKIIANISVELSVLQLRLMLIVVSLEGAIAIPLAWFRMQQRVLTFFLATILRTIAQAIMIVVFLHLGFGVSGVLVASLIAAVLQAAILSAMMINEVGIVFKLNQFKQFLSYSLPIVGSGFIAFSLAGFDRWLLAAQHSLTDVAIYGVAAKFALATALLVQPFGMWWLPKRFSLLKEPAGVIKVAHGIMIGIIVVMTVAVMVSFIAPFLIHSLLAPAYHPAIQYVLWLVLAMAFKEIAELVNIGCFYGQSTYQQLAINLICAAIGLTIMWLGIEKWGIWAVVIALNIAYVSKALLFYIASQHNLPLPYHQTKILGIIICATALITLSQYIPMSFIGWSVSMLALSGVFVTTLKHDLLSLNLRLG
ncbi:MAG: oligosaccharide flippase family protein [Gammaproteobacteria bacterium]|nr:oligosaccharide flippase family protein [Gammaproteobacteria bacterium]